MPNWCHNSLQITGPSESIAALKHAARDEKTGSLFSLDRLYPVPECLHVDSPPPEEVAAANIALTGFPSWYEWSIERWGTKWDVCRAQEMAASDGNWELFFDSAWSPPLRAIHKISGDFPDLVFNAEYFEPLMDFCGMAVFSAGKCLRYGFGNSDEVTENLQGSE